MKDGCHSGAAVAIKLGMEMFKRVTPKGIARISTWIRGKELLIIGQPRAGKTTFVDYLRYGILEDEHDTPKTYDIMLTPTFTIKMGRNSALELRLRRTLDVPGQQDPGQHAGVAFQRCPHALVIFLDLSTPLELEGEPPKASGTWLSEFCDYFEALWIRQGKRKRNRTQSITIVMNKMDKVSQDTLFKHEQTYKSIVKKLVHARGKKLEQIRIMPCVLVTNDKGTEPVDKVIAAIAKSLVK